MKGRILNEFGVAECRKMDGVPAAAGGQAAAGKRQATCGLLSALQIAHWQAMRFRA
jgi:hypothetical protein